MAPLLLDNRPAYTRYEVDAGTYTRRPTRQSSRANADDDDDDDAGNVRPSTPNHSRRDTSPQRKMRSPPAWTSDRARTARVERERDEYYPYASPSRSRRQDRSWSSSLDPGSVQAKDQVVMRTFDDTRDLVTIFNLGSKAPGLNGLRWNTKTKTWAHASQVRNNEPVSKLDILSSTSFSGHSDRSTVELKCATEWGMHDDYFLRWSHLQRPSLDFEEFAHVATRMSGLSEEMMLVVDHLLATVQKELQRTYVHGKYLAPGSIRCDGRNGDDRTKEDTTAAFTCIPYFSFEKAHAPVHKTASAQKDLHHSRTLLQWQYDGESTSDRDSTQALGLTNGAILHVSAVWTLIAGSDVMLTAAPLTMQEMMKPDIDQVPKPRDSHRDRMVQVSDPYKRQYFFPMDSCQTFFELRQLVQAQCLEDILLDESSCDFLFDSDEPLQASTWMQLVNSKDLALVTISVREKRESRSVRAIKDTGEQREESPRNERQGPDNEPAASWINHPEAWQIKIRRRTTLQRERRRDTGAAVVDDLRRKGLIVNDPASLVEDINTKTFGPEDVKMFQLQPTAKMNASSDIAASSEPPTQDDSNKEAASDGTQRSKPSNAPRSESRPAAPTVLTDVPQMTLRIPPFFMWKLESRGSQPDSKRLTADLTVLSKTLDSLEKTLYSRDHNISEIDRYGVEDEFRYGRSYRETDEKGHAQLLSSKNDLINIMTKEPSDEGIPTEASDLTTPHESEHAGVTPFTDPDGLLVRERRWETKRIVQLLVKISEDIASCYAPIAYDHQVLRKIWGALGSIITGAAAEDAYETTANTPNDAWIVQESLPNISDALPIPIRKFHDCTQCRAYTSYGSQPDAIRHVVTVHYPAGTALSAAEMKAIKTTISNATTMSKLETARRTNLFLADVVDFLQTLHAKTYDMVEGLANVDREDDTLSELNFGLPLSLVQAFETFFNFLTASARVLPLMGRNFSGWSSTNAVQWDSRFSKYTLFIRFLGLRADYALSDAMKDIVLLIRTGEASKTVNYTAVGPRFISLVFLSQLLLRPIVDDDDIVQLCAKRTSALQYQVLHRPPRRRLLADIQSLQEEISAVKSIRYQQDDSFDELCQIYSPDTFRISSQSRSQQYDLERAFIWKTHEKFRRGSDVLRNLVARLQDLENTARFRIDVLEEDNSKTIFVFTVVTAVFLPLSFVTSYLGMNTADIRNTTTSQSTFWAIALPLTFVVVVLAVLVAYRGDALLGRIRDLGRIARERSSLRRGPKAISSNTRRVAGESTASPHESTPDEKDFV